MRFKCPSRQEHRYVARTVIGITHPLSLQVELFHHSRDVPATITTLLSTLDRASGNVTKKNPRSVYRILACINMTLSVLKSQGLNKRHVSGSPNCDACWDFIRADIGSAPYSPGAVFSQQRYGENIDQARRGNYRCR